MTEYSATMRASGVACWTLTADLLSSTAATIAWPPIISALGSPFDEFTNCARPIVPPAPPLLSYCTLEASFESFMTLPSVRPVWSQPPPGLAGMRILTDCWASAPVAANARATAARPRVRTFMTSP
jgi:hypothetical protein